MKYGGYWCEKHKKKHTELTMGYYGCKACYDDEQAKPVNPDENAFDVREMNRLFRDSILNKTKAKLNMTEEEKEIECDICGAKPFGVESWWSPRSATKSPPPPVFCSKCIVDYRIDGEVVGGLNVIEENKKEDK